MVVECTWKIVYQLLLSSFILYNVVFCELYVRYPLESERICHPLARKGKITGSTSILNLNDAKTAIIIKPEHMFDRWIVTADRYCKFTVETHKGVQLFAAIQKMSFRRNGTKCLDYLKFKRRDGYESEEFCGQFDWKSARYFTSPETESSEENEDSGSYAIFDVKGKLQTKIFISKEPLQKDETLDLNIVYTPYIDCEKVDSEDFLPVRESSCIWKDFFCDGYLNCAFDNCVAEESECPGIIVSNGTGTKVTVGAVTTIFLCFLIFVVCLWICRRHKKLCWSSDCAGPTTANDNIPQLERQMNRPVDSPVASAPMLEVVVPAPVLDKDLPPSYDSLFPNQPNSTTTQ